MIRYLDLRLTDVQNRYSPTFIMTASNIINIYHKETTTFACPKTGRSSKTSERKMMQKQFEKNSKKPSHFISQLFTRQSNTSNVHSTSIHPQKRTKPTKNKENKEEKNEPHPHNNGSHSKRDQRRRLLENRPRIRTRRLHNSRLGSIITNHNR